MYNRYFLKHFFNFYFIYFILIYLRLFKLSSCFTVESALKVADSYLRNSNYGTKPADCPYRNKGSPGILSGPAPVFAACCNATLCIVA